MPGHYRSRTGHYRSRTFLPVSFVTGPSCPPRLQEETDFLQTRYGVRPGGHDSTRTAALVSQRTLTGDTALHLAVSSGSLDLLELLLRHVPDPNLRERYCGATPLHLACRLGRPDLADVLLRSGRVDVNATDYGRRTALRHLWDAQRQNPRSKDLLWRTRTTLRKTALRIMTNLRMRKIAFEPTRSTVGCRRMAIPRVNDVGAS
ncbi:hypothetical protein MTO96_042425 [Rhipicephalus appendiculatus]